VMAADAAGAREVIAVDVDPDRLDVASDLGATGTIDTRETDPVDRIEEIGGVGHTFEFVGHTNEVRQQAIESVERGGTAVLSGAATDEASANLTSVIGEGKTVVGNVAGSVRPLVDIPTRKPRSKIWWPARPSNPFCAAREGFTFPNIYYISLS